MIKKVKDQTGKELTNADVDIILMKKEVSKIMKSTHATSCTPKDCQCGVDVIEYQLIAFITNALNQQRSEVILEFLLAMDNPKQMRDEYLRKMNLKYRHSLAHQTDVSRCNVCKKEFLTKLEEEK